MSNYTSSIVSRYGDTERVKQDVITLNEIMSRQGTSLLIDVIAESCGQIALRYKINAVESETLRKALVTELNEAILERT